MSEKIVEGEILIKARELVKVEKQIVKVSAVLDELWKKRSELLQALGG